MQCNKILQGCKKNEAGSDRQITNDIEANANVNFGIWALEMPFI